MNGDLTGETESQISCFLLNLLQVYKPKLPHVVNHSTHSSTQFLQESKILDADTQPRHSTHESFNHALKEHHSHRQNFPVDTWTEHILAHNLPSVSRQRCKPRFIVGHTITNHFISVFITHVSRFINTFLFIGPMAASSLSDSLMELSMNGNGRASRSASGYLHHPVAPPSPPSSQNRPQVFASPSQRAGHNTLQHRQQHEMHLQHQELMHQQHQSQLQHQAQLQSSLSLGYGPGQGQSQGYGNGHTNGIRQGQGQGPGHGQGYGSGQSLSLNQGRSSGQVSHGPAHVCSQEPKLRA